MSRDTVVLTASAGAFPGLAATLADLGVELRTQPLLSFAPPLDWHPLDSALAQRRRYRAVALTSPRAAQALAERIDATGVSWQESALPVWVVGVTTEEALQAKSAGYAGQTVCQVQGKPLPRRSLMPCLRPA
ncbi:MAG TPA: uroporphyrinogen-III synthase [Gemmatimonadales bacterium]|nr:uroporphyrinogen-III synthase [Gemmatimonadales bacterium]